MIFRVTGYGRVLLGGASGVALFSKAAFGKNRISDECKATLWGLFILGLTGGMVILASVR